METTAERYYKNPWYYVKLVLMIIVVFLFINKNFWLTAVLVALIFGFFPERKINLWLRKRKDRRLSKHNIE